MIYRADPSRLRGERPACLWGAWRHVPIAFERYPFGCLEGQNGVLEAVRWRPNGAQRRRPIRHVFNFIGADPNSDWLASSGLVFDKKGLNAGNQLIGTRYKIA